MSVFLYFFIATAPASTVYSYGECVVIVEDQHTHPSIMLKSSAMELGLSPENEPKLLLPSRISSMAEALIVPDVMALSPQEDQPIQVAEVVVTRVAVDVVNLVSLR